MSKCPRLIIDLNAVKSNYRAIKNKVEKAECGAVVKANAYGLGVKEISMALAEEGCSIFFVSYSYEAVELRKILAKSAEIIVLHGPDTEDIEDFVAYNLTPVLNTLQQCQLWENTVNNINTVKNARTSLTSPVLQLDCGFNRLGLKENDIKVLLNYNFSFIKKGLRMIMSHLPCASDSQSELNQVHKEKFDYLCSLLPLAPVSLSASDALFLGREYIYDVIRLGSALYGLNTDSSREIKMKPVVSIEAPVINIGTMKVGETIGYDASYKAKKETVYAVLSIGYADGLPRSLEREGLVWFKINNQYYKAPIIGKISMDITACDITELPAQSVQIADMGSFLYSEYSVGAMLNKPEAYARDLFTNLSNRYQRIYKA